MFLLHIFSPPSSLLYFVCFTILFLEQKGKTGLHVEEW